MAGGVFPRRHAGRQPGRAVRAALGLACALLPGLAGAVDGVDVQRRCYVGGPATAPIRLELTWLRDSAFHGGYARYARGSGAIPLVLLASDEIETYPGRPSTFRSTWLEIVDAVPGGRYVLETQGARTYGLEYIATDGRRVGFVEDLDALSDADARCRWP
ncbi:hypothetical protein [Luteimonas deserti]|uniref:DUF2846 domain-containing protein n=1 Tax=Luteimonas deserti TaxID=2752306 RepID=A0A7Z0QS21_9GAMM|nr:hypothetical protein [Luteimonas deserti]NYZ63089.1 hypothetical protein [Luteimonas deserti]